MACADRQDEEDSEQGEVVEALGFRVCHASGLWSVCFGQPETQASQTTRPEVRLDSYSHFCELFLAEEWIGNL
jgi:hypothetical protein